MKLQKRRKLSFIINEFDILYTKNTENLCNWPGKPEVERQNLSFRVRKIINDSQKNTNAGSPFIPVAL